MKLGRLIHQQARDASDNRWLEGLEAIVAVNEDPEFQHRIKVVIPALDEDQVFNKWIRSMSVHVLGVGYGMFMMPPIGSEVTLWSRFGDKHNLFYTPAYNEDYVVPADFRDPAVAGIRAPGDLKFICDGDMQLRSGGLRMQADFGAIQITAPAGVFINGRPY